MRWITTPAFCKAALLEECLKNLYKVNLHEQGFTHVVIDGHYPIDKEENRVRIQELCRQYGCHYLDPGKDLGLHGNLNFAVHTLRIGADETLINVDPDDFPQPGSMEKLANAIEINPQYAVIAMSFCLINQRVEEGKLQVVCANGRILYLHPTVEMFKVAAFNMRFIHSLPNKFHEPWAYYGGLESYLYGEWRKEGLKLGYIQDHCQEVKLDILDSKYFDQSYRQWKHAHLSGFNGSFEEWIRSQAV